MHHTFRQRPSRLAAACCSLSSNTAFCMSTGGGLNCARIRLGMADSVFGCGSSGVESTFATKVFCFVSMLLGSWLDSTPRISEAVSTPARNFQAPTESYCWHHPSLMLTAEDVQGNMHGKKQKGVSVPCVRMWMKTPCIRGLGREESVIHTSQFSVKGMQLMACQPEVHVMQLPRPQH